MPATMPSSVLKLSQATDYRKTIFEALGKALDDFRVMGQQVLVGTYIEPEKQGSLYMPQSTQQESLYQGSQGIVLKKGPWAFQDDAALNIDWKGENVEIGEWVVFKYSDAWELHLNGVSVRLIDDRSIRAVVPTPRLLTSKPFIAALA